MIKLEPEGMMALQQFSGQKMAQSPFNDITQPVDSEEEGRSSTMDRQ